MTSKRVQTPLVCHGHERPIVELSFSPVTPDGYFLTSASKDGLPMLRNGATGDWIGTFQGHKGAVWSCILNDPAMLAATASADFSARVWNALSGDHVHTFSEKHIVRTLQFTHHSSKLITAGYEKLIRLYDLERPEAPPQEISGSPDKIRTASLHPQDNVLLTAFVDKPGIRQAACAPCLHMRWHHHHALCSATVRHVQIEHRPHITCRISCSPCDKLVACSSSPSMPNAWTLSNLPVQSSMHEQRALQHHKGGMPGKRPGCCSVWDMRSASIVRNLETTSIVTSIEVQPDGSRYTTADGHEVRVWDGDSLKVVKSHRFEYEVESASLCRSKGRIAAGGGDLWVHLHDYDSGVELECNKGHHGPVHCVRFAPGGESYASGSEDGTIRIWETDYSLKDSHVANGLTANGN